MRVAAEILVRVSSIAATLVVTRSLGVTAFGSFAVALAFGLMAGEVASLGVNALVVPLIVRNGANLRALIAVKARLTLAACLLSAALVPVAADRLGLEAAVLALATAHFIATSWVEFAGSALRAIGHRRDEALLLGLSRVLLLGFVLVTPASLGALGVGLAYAGAGLAGAGAAAIWLLRLGALVRFPEAGLGAREILALAWPLGANGWLAVLSTRIEILILQSVASAGLVGLWSGALRVVESLLALPAAIAAGALPAISRDVASRAQGAAQRTLGAVVWIGTPAAVGLAFRAPDVLALLGPGFEAGAPALRVLSVALLLCFANTALFHLMIAVGQTAVIPRLTLARVLVAVVAGAPLIRAFGLAGAAASFTLAEGVLCAILTSRCRVHIAIDIARPARWALIACGPMAALLLVVHWPLAWSVAASALLFASMALTILDRGAEAGGLA